MKYWIRARRDDILAEMGTGLNASDVLPFLWQAVLESMTPQHIAGWYADSGYLAHSM